LFSSIITAPLIYWLAERWLANYPEHIGLSIWFVAIPFLFMLVLVILTSISQILKAALKNPVESLKYE
jgi:putative ABC transport system permease protein